MCYFYYKNHEVFICGCFSSSGRGISDAVSLDRTKITTTRTDLDACTLSAEHGNLTVELLDDNTAHLAGSLDILADGSGKVEFDAALRKFPSSAPTVDVNSALNGEWQSEIEVSDDGRTINLVNGGGYNFYDEELASISKTFMNLTFIDTNIQTGNYEYKRYIS